MKEQSIVSMGHFTAIGMRTYVAPYPDGTIPMVVNTCSDNGKDSPGDELRWSWCNPTNTAIQHTYAGVTAVSVECLWQGTKIMADGGVPDERILRGEKVDGRDAWKLNKGKRPVGAWAGEGMPLITDPGEARRRIYVPAFRRLIEHWLEADEGVREVLRIAREWRWPVYLRDHDTGRGIDRNGPMSHAWLMCEWLNTGRWPA